ncbi:hypothetical protein BJ741DRAFT_535334 [Chytriomyces cf. hyalinus JEL632]|nr:hypothetical protein BJ741DRAFT_535334 [Chytriomyces cf. hyalinus JEL632]
MAHNPLKTVVIAGVGPGVGSATARAFQKEGYHVALLSRSMDYLSNACLKQSLANELGNATAVQCDLTEKDSVASAARAISGMPPVEVVVLNAGGPSTFRRGSVLDMDADDLAKAVSARTVGPLRLLQHLLPSMVINHKLSHPKNSAKIERKEGSVFFTGATASLRGSANFAYVAVPAFSTRALAESTARELMPLGLHVSHLVLDGIVDSENARGWKPDAGPDDLIQPARVADTFLMLHRQPKSVWTFELTVRPANEIW